MSGSFLDGYTPDEVRDKFAENAAHYFWELGVTSSFPIELVKNQHERYDENQNQVYSPYAASRWLKEEEITSRALKKRALTKATKRKNFRTKCLQNENIK